MKKLLLLLVFAFIGCTAEELPVEEPCFCTMNAKRYISSDLGETWYYNGNDTRHGLVFECEFARELIYEQGGYLYKLVIECR